MSAIASIPWSFRPTPTPNMRAAISATISVSERLFSRTAARYRAGYALGNARGHGADGGQSRKTPSRGRLGATRARHEIRADGAYGRSDADLHILHPAGRAGLRQDGDFHAEADLWRQRVRHALPPVDLERRQAAIRRQQIR